MFNFHIFSSKFYELFNLFLPLYTVKFNKNIHYKEKWFSQGLAVSRREKNRLDNIAANIKKFKDFRNLYNKITKAAKKRYFEDELSKNKSNLKKTWSLIRQAVKLKSSKSDATLSTILINDVEVHDPLLIAEHLNSFFSSAPALIINDFPLTPEPDPEPEVQGVPLFNLLENEITTLEIVETVKMLESKKSSDSGGVSMFFIKKCIYSIARPLRHVFGLSFAEGIFPEQF